MNCEFIGDIHGHADAAEALLDHLGYRQTGGAWRHPERQVLFVGDFIDRGPQQRESVGTGSANGGPRVGTGGHGQSRIQCHCIVY
jgi:hypothetical protein